MQHTLKTNKGDTLLLVEVPLDAYGFKIVDLGVQGKYVGYYFNDNNYSLGDRYINWRCDEVVEIIGTTSTLTDKEVEPFVDISQEHAQIINHYLNYLERDWSFNTALESFNSLLEVNNIDTSKNYCILKLLNNE